ncbi:hypothetical protein WR25_16812 [Diploscapter pachys]|uniref:G-protein coupled receptors family 1 profile domain-containing protein n=1 Tax=Diploscapter pachys TaxID=2018661 RepID=A0A2A2K700_9BILA|nr:hypothetical protein WR25_16812 [Diploscapter pachys]
MHLFALFSHLISRLCVHATSLLNYSNLSGNGCDILVDYASCLYIRTPFNLFQYMTQSTPVFLVIERIFATRLRRRLMQVGTNLRKRYQVEENIRSMKLLQPIENAMTFFLVGYFFIRWFIVYFHEHLATQTYYSFFELSSFLPEYSIFLPIFTHIRRKQLKIQDLNNLKESINIKGDKYFEMILSSWQCENAEYVSTTSQNQRTRPE